MPAPGLGKCLDSSYFENSRVSCTLDLMESELLIWSEQRSSFITTSGIKNEAVSGRTQMFCLSVSILCFQSRGYFAVSQIVHISYLLGHCPFADKGIHMQLASDVSVENVKGMDRLQLPLNYTQIQHENSDF